MNRKNLILGAVAIVFATGSAFTSALVDPQSVYAKTKMTSDPDEIALCRLTNRATCDDDGGSTCRVTITSTSQGATPVDGRLSTCAVINNTNGTAVSAALSSGQTPFFVE